MSATTEDIGDYQRWVSLYDTLSDTDRDGIRKHLGELTYKPLISVIMPAYESNRQTFEDALRSVTTQLYPNWELCIVDDASPSPHVSLMARELASMDPRVKWSQRAENGHISAASNSALALASGEFIALMDHDDLIPEHALYEVVVELNAHADTDIVFTDEDKLDSNAVRHEPYFKSGWDRELFLAHNILSHFCVFRRSIIDAIQGFRLGLEGSQDYDISLRAISQTTDAKIRHIPSVLYHWRADTNQFSERQIDRCISAARRAKADYLATHGIAAEVTENSVVTSWDRVRRTPSQPPPLVTLLVQATRVTSQIERLLRNIATGPYKAVEVIVRAKHAHGSELHKLSGPDLEVRFVPKETGLSRWTSANIDAASAHGSIIGFLSDDLEPQSLDWLSEIVTLAEADRFGVIGGKIVAPDNSIRAAGYMLSPEEIAIPVHAGVASWEGGYFGRLCLTRSVSALSGDALFLRKSLFEAVGGFDAKLRNFADIDLCLKVAARGYQNIWTPFAEFKSHEWPHTGWLEKRLRAREVRDMRSRWAAELSCESHYNTNLALENGKAFKLAFPPRADKAWSAYL